MNVLEITKLDPKSAAMVAEKLTQLMADMQIFYTNLRGFHWNVTGQQFYQLHAYFEEQYKAYETHIDDVAERLLQLGARPTAHFSEYLKTARVKEACSKRAGLDMMKVVADTLTTLIADERAIAATAEAVHDNATVDLMNSLLDEQEKAAWMLAAYLG